MPPGRPTPEAHRWRNYVTDTPGELRDGRQLSRALGLSDMFFINMQARYEAEIARDKLAVELGTIERIA